MELKLALCSINTVSDTLSFSFGTYNLTGGTLALKRITTGTGNAALNLGGGTLQANASFQIWMPITLTGIGGNTNVNTNGNVVTLSGILSGPGSLNKLGSGILTLSAANTYTGNTSINAGSLSLTSAGSIAYTPLIDVLANAIFNVSSKNPGGGFTLGSQQTLMGGGIVFGNITAPRAATLPRATRRAFLRSQAI